MNVQMLTTIAWLIQSSGPGGGQVRSGVSPMPQLINEIKQFERINGKTFRFVVELARAGAKQSSAATTSQLPKNFRGEVRALLTTAHLNTDPVIYSKRLAGGGPFKQRTDVMMAGLTSLLSKRDKPMNRKEAKAQFFAMDELRFFPGKGPLAKALNAGTAFQVAASTKSLFKGPIAASKDN